MLPLIRLAKHIAVSNVAELKDPYRITFALTYRCQFTCAMCGIGGRKPTAELTAGEIGEFFGRAPGFSWINLSGGEIFLRPDLMQVLRAIVQANAGLYLLNFPTNGYLSDTIVDTVREMIRSLSIPRLMITVSLDGPPHLHDEIRCMPGSWDKAVDTFRRLRKLRSSHFSVVFGMTLQDRNADAFDGMVRSVRELIPDIGHEDFHVNLLHLSDHYYGNAACGGIRDKERVLHAFQKAARTRSSGLLHPVAFLERRYQGLAEQFLRTGITPVPCQALNASLFMDPSGTIYPCTIHDKPLGSIRDAGYELRRIWNSAQRLSIRQEVQGGVCPHCWTPCEAYQAILANVLPGSKR